MSSIILLSAQAQHAGHIAAQQHYHNAAVLSHPRPRQMTTFQQPGTGVNIPAASNPPFSIVNNPVLVNTRPVNGNPAVGTTDTIFGPVNTGSSTIDGFFSDLGNLINTRGNGNGNGNFPNNNGSTLFPNAPNPNLDNIVGNFTNILENLFGPATPTNGNLTVVPGVNSNVNPAPGTDNGSSTGGLGNHDLINSSPEPTSTPSLARTTSENEHEIESILSDPRPSAADAENADAAVLGQNEDAEKTDDEKEKAAEDKDKEDDKDKEEASGDTPSIGGGYGDNRDDASSEDTSSSSSDKGSEDAKEGEIFLPPGGNASILPAVGAALAMATLAVALV